MRVISKDGNINVPYETTVFCLIADGDEFSVAFRNPALTGYMPLATYETEELAKSAFKSMVVAGETYTTNAVFYLT